MNIVRVHHFGCYSPLYTTPYLSTSIIPPLPFFTLVRFWSHNAAVLQCDAIRPEQFEIINFSRAFNFWTNVLTSDEQIKTFVGHENERLRVPSIPRSLVQKNDIWNIFFVNREDKNNFFLSFNGRAIKETRIF